MKPLFFLLLGVAAALAGGCATALKPIPLSPNTTTVKVNFAASDARAPVKISPRYDPAPAQGQIVGSVYDLILYVLSDDRLAAQFVAERARASGAAMKAVKLTRFETRRTIGMWAGTVWCDVAAEITLEDGRVATVTGAGRDITRAALPRNWEIAIERAMDDFGAKIKQLVGTP